MIQTLFENPIIFVFSLISIVIAITIHEFAHAKMADYLGDPTPNLQGRVTVNPLAHIDLYGLLFLFLAGFGWGKPVQFDPFNLKHQRRDSAIISLAGPTSNIIIASIGSIILHLFNNIILTEQGVIGSLFLVSLISINLMLAVFNLIPVHPLDGFKIVEGLLTEKQAQDWRKLEKLGFILLLLLVFPFNGESAISTILGPILRFLYSIFIPF
ncbi:MAG TPA: site-2 protease family protein [Candidatus Woesebacteria bacterium]|nr:site-2 protease family protein [Candidatus Woesebacteria bacterium]